MHFRLAWVVYTVIALHIIYDRKWNGYCHPTAVKECLVLLVFLITRPHNIQLRGCTIITWNWTRERESAEVPQPIAVPSLFYLSCSTKEGGGGSGLISELHVILVQPLITAMQLSKLLLWSVCQGLSWSPPLVCNSFQTLRFCSSS